MAKLTTPVALMLSLAPAVASSQIRLGSEFQVNTYTTNWQWYPSVASDAQGNFVVVWLSSGHIFGRRYDASGVPQEGEFRVDSFDFIQQLSGYRPAVASDAKGNFLVLWTGSQDGGPYDVFGQRFDASGMRQGGAFRVNSYTTDRQFRPAIASDANGNFVVVWTSDNQDGGGTGVFGQRFDPSGTPQGGEFQVNSYTAFNDVFPDVASDADGNVVVVWERQHAEDRVAGVFGQRFDTSGARQGGEFRVNLYTAGPPDIASDAYGNFVVVWGSSCYPPPDACSVWGRRYDAAGVAQGEEFRLTPYVGTGPAVAADANGFVVTWDGFGQGVSSFGILGIGSSPAPSNVFGQRYDVSGVPQGRGFQVNSYNPDSQYRSAVASDVNGHMIVVWQSNGQDGSGLGVFGQRFGTDLLFRDGFEQSGGAPTSSNAVGDDSRRNESRVSFGWAAGRFRRHRSSRALATLSAGAISPR